MITRTGPNYGSASTTSQQQYAFSAFGLVVLFVIVMATADSTFGQAITGILILVIVFLVIYHYRQIGQAFFTPIN